MYIKSHKGQRTRGKKTWVLVHGLVNQPSMLGSLLINLSGFFLEESCGGRLLRYFIDFFFYIWAIVCLFLWCPNWVTKRSIYLWKEDRNKEELWHLEAASGISELSQGYIKVWILPQNIFGFTLLLSRCWLLNYLYKQSILIRVLQRTEQIGLYLYP